MTTLYVVLGATLVALLSVMVWAAVTDPTVGRVFLVILGMILMVTVFSLLVRLTKWADDVLERSKK
jgi:membrane protein YdbS with pleckstrin-like domain